jgi:hypothetical protein
MAMQHSVKSPREKWLTRLDQATDMADRMTAEKAGSQYSYLEDRTTERAAGGEAEKAFEGHFNQEGYWQSSAESTGLAGNATAELESGFESQPSEVQVGVSTLGCSTSTIVL